MGQGGGQYEVFYVVRTIVGHSPRSIVSFGSVSFVLLLCFGPRSLAACSVHWFSASTEMLGQAVAATVDEREKTYWRLEPCWMACVFEVAWQRGVHQWSCWGDGMVEE